MEKELKEIKTQLAALTTKINILAAIMSEINLKVVPKDYLDYLDQTFEVGLNPIPEITTRPVNVDVPDSKL